MLNAPSSAFTGLPSLSVIESGSAKVTSHGEERTTLGPGAYFGEVALIDDGPRTATVTAVGDVKAHVLVAWDFRPMVKEDPDLAWYGYSAGKWEGDEFVIDTMGLDPRAWADEEGLPKSDSARIQERYHRLDRDNMEMTVIITDPKFFTKPVTGKFMWRLQPNTPTGNFIEDIFAPIDEERFNKRVRNPAGGVDR